MGSPLSGVVQGATVFRRGASVRRFFALPAGQDAVSLGPLPRVVDDGAVRVVDAKGARVRELRVVLAAFTQDVDLPLADSEVIEEARLAVARAEARVATLEESLAALAQLAVMPRRGAPDQAPGPSPHAARLELARFRAERTRTWRLAALDARQELDRARDRLAVEEDRERRASSARRTRVDEVRKRVDLVFEAPTEEGASLVVEYGVPGACWAPSYALRFDEAMSRVRLERRAYVAQRSGEDWAGAHLVLSTAERTRFATLPDLPSLRIGRRQPPPRRGWRPPPSGAEELFADFDAAFPLSDRQVGSARLVSRSVPAAASSEGAAADARRPPVMPTAAPKGGAPPPPPAAARGALAGPPGAPMHKERMPIEPAPSEAMPSEAMRGAPMLSSGRPPSAKPRQESRKRAALFDADGVSASTLQLAVAEPEEVASSGVAIDVELLAYARLRLAGIEERGTRGKLRPLGRSGELTEALRDRAVVGDLGASLALAERDATRLAPLPPGARLAAAVDGFDHAFEASARVDVPSDGQWHAVRLAEEEQPCEARLVVVPRQTDEVFRFVRLKVTGAPLVPGAADVFIGERYLLTRSLGPTSVGGELRLGLGIEPTVRVARNVRFEERASGLMGRSLELVHDVEVELRSSATTRRLVEVRERVPTTREGDDDVEVREDEVSPSWERWEPDANDGPQGSFEGGRRWVVTLEPGAARTLRARWVVRIAAKNELVGGNRREP